MRRRWIHLSLLLVLAPIGASQSRLPRDLAMGGAGVATSRSVSTLFVNPALVRRNAVPPEFALAFPVATAVFTDQDDLRDDVNDLQDTLRALRDLVAVGDPGADALRPVAAEQLARVGGDLATIDVGLDLNLVVPRETFTFGIGLRSFVDVRAFGAVDAADFDTLSTSTDPDEFDDLVSQVVLPAAQVEEIGFTIAADFDVFGRPVSFGLTPKFQSVRTSLYSVSVSRADESDARRDFDDLHDQEDSANVDFGLAVDVSQNLRAGLAVTNLVSHTFDAPAIGGRTFAYELEPLPTLGLAYEDADWTVALDADLARTSRFEGIADTQFLRLGAEYRQPGWIALRAGVAVDLEDTVPDRWSLGLGFPLYIEGSLDVAAVFGDESIGGALAMNWVF